MIKPTKRVSKKTGEVSYLLRVNIGFVNGEQIIRSKTWKPDRKMTPKQLDEEAYKQLVFFEQEAKAEYEAELQREAEQKRLEAEERLKRDDFVEYAKQHTTFQELADKWLAKQEKNKDMKHSSLQRMKSCKERTYIAIGHILVSKLNFDDIDNFIISLAQDGTNKFNGKGLSQKTQKHYLTFISDVMYYAKVCRIIESNPCTDYRFNTKEKKEIQAYSLDEVNTIISALDEKAPTMYKLFYNLLAFNGLRRGEALGLEFGDIDYKKSIVSINRTSNYHVGYGIYTDTPKTKNSYRSLKIDEKILGLIKQLKAERKQQAIQCGDQWQDSDRLFVNWCGKPLSPNIPHKWLQRFCQKEGLPFHGLHSFRHFTGTQLIANGLDPKRTSMFLGHSQTSTTMNYYVHSVEQANESACDCIANLLKTG